MEITPGLITFAAGIAGICIFLGWGIKMMLAGELSLENRSDASRELPGYGQMPAASTTGNFTGEKTGGSNPTWEYENQTRTMGLETRGIGDETDFMK